MSSQCWLVCPSLSTQDPAPSQGLTYLQELVQVVVVVIMLLFQWSSWCWQSDRAAHSSQWSTAATVTGSSCCSMGDCCLLPVYKPTLSPHRWTTHLGSNNQVRSTLFLPLCLFTSCDLWLWLFTEPTQKLAQVLGVNWCNMSSWLLVSVFVHCASNCLFWLKKLKFSNFIWVVSLVYVKKDQHKFSWIFNWKLLQTVRRYQRPYDCKVSGVI